MKESENYNRQTYLSDLCFAVQQHNLVYNHDFRYFSNKNDSATIVDFGHPDGWIYEDDDKDGSLSFNPNNNTVVIKTGTDPFKMNFSQALHEFPRWEPYLIGAMVTSKVRFVLNDKVEVRISITDGVVTRSSSIKASGLVELPVQLEVNEKADKLVLSIQCLSPSATLEIEKAWANRGEMIVESLPCIVNGIIGERNQYVATENAPIEELSLCANPPIQLNKLLHSRLNSVINYRFGTDPNKMSVLPDMRGVFSRSWNNGSKKDTGASQRTAIDNNKVLGDHVGTYETDEFEQHNHEVKYSAPITVTPGDKSSVVSAGVSQTKERGGFETRAKNIAELYTLKWA